MLHRGNVDTIPEFKIDLTNVEQLYEALVFFVATKIYSDYTKAVKAKYSVEPEKFVEDWLTIVFKKITVDIKQGIWYYFIRYLNREKLGRTSGNIDTDEEVDNAE